MSKFFSIILLAAMLLLPRVGAFADTVCQPVYGGGQNCITTGNILVNKKVQNPRTKEFVDNLGTADDKFSPSDTVTFQILVTNTGGSTIQQTSIKDTFPGFVSFVSGAGNFDNSTKTLTFVTDNLAPNETRTFTLTGKVVDVKDVPDGVTCVVNQATATTNTGQMSQDNAQLCIQKQVTTKGGLPVFPPPKVATTPPTGPELIPLIGLLPAGLSGWFLRKKSKTNFRGGEK